MAHSKRNTSLAFFTSYERSLLKGEYGTIKSRLSRESFKAFDACNLCLMRARDPVACEHSGDIFCRECAVENLITQRKEIVRMQKELDARIQEEEEERLRLEAEAQQRAIQDFELLQMGLEIKTKEAGEQLANRRTIVGRQNGKLVVEEEETPAGGRGSDSGRKRKFELDEEELMNIAKEETQRAKKILTEEKNAKEANKLRSFWLPSLTPSVGKTDILQKAPKLRPVCPASDNDKIHHYSLKELVTVNFTEDDTEKTKHGEVQRICPSCKKGLNNATKAMLAKPCGHVICKPCVDKFMMSDMNDPHVEDKSIRCYVCSIDLTTKPDKSEKKSSKKTKKKDKSGIKPGLVLMKGDGTGFAAAGGNVTSKKEGTAFLV